MGYARFMLPCTIAIVRVLGGGEESFPGNARGIIDPGFFRFGITAGGLPLLDNVASRLAQASIDLLQFLSALDAQTHLFDLLIIGPSKILKLRRKRIAPEEIIRRDARTE